MIPVDESNLAAAGAVHSAAWQASHCSFCAPDFVAARTPERQTQYLREKLERGAKLFLLLADKPAGVVSVTGSLIEDLYVLPERQNQGYGTKLLQYAAKQCEGTPTLWVLENNTRAAKLYERLGFRRSGAQKDGGRLSEFEFKLT
ncbi:MAG: GNAT family N-acetyltransferase [Ruminococcaceae bacterium]|nr:GNAT family N-acetyltransferase [Oscillospiraceae bacterium]